MCDYDYSYVEIASRDVVTRKRHECGSCLQRFPAGTKMRYSFGKTEGDLGSSYACPACQWCLAQDDHSDLHLCWGWNWDGTEYDDSKERWEFVNETLAKGETPTVEAYKAWFALKPVKEEV